MSTELINKWLTTGLYARIDQQLLRPIEHKLLHGKPLCCSKGQADVIFLVDDNGTWWILKKFHSRCSLDVDYLEKIASLLPDDQGLLCGKQRKILPKDCLSSSPNLHYDPGLNTWLEGTIIMPRIEGLDWSTLADELRSGNIHLDKMQRLTLCRNLTQLIELLEQNQCCHRDLSCGNVFIDTDTWQVSLIDFDSLYHTSLLMPGATTCGTSGYAAPYIWTTAGMDARISWQLHADRFALCLLIVEFLLVEKSSKATGEGGIFEQDELKNSDGKELKVIIDTLKTKNPQAATYLEQTIKSKGFSQCPSPQDWLNFFKTIPGLSTSMSGLKPLSSINPDYFVNILSKCRPAAPLQPIPNFKDIPKPVISLPKKMKQPVRPKPVRLPSDPWKGKTKIPIGAFK